MTSLRHAAPSPRPNTALPRYPRLAALGIAVAVASCGTAARRDAAPVRSPVPLDRADPGPPTLVVPPRSGRSLDALPALASEPEMRGREAAPAMPEPSFPDDDGPLPVVGCGGGCPPAYVLATEAKDRSQMRARIRYCGAQARARGQAVDGTISVSADIGPDGKAREVRAERSGTVPLQTVACVERLVASAPFSSKHGLERTSTESAEVDREE